MSSCGRGRGVVFTDIGRRVQGCGRTGIDTTGREPGRVSAVGIGRGVVLRI